MVLGSQGSRTGAPPFLELRLNDYALTSTSSSGWEKPLQDCAACDMRHGNLSNVSTSGLNGLTS